MNLNNISLKDAKKRIEKLKEEQEIRFNPYREKNIIQLENFVRGLKRILDVGLGAVITIWILIFWGLI